MQPDYGPEREPELDPIRDLVKRVRLVRPDGTHEDLTPEQARERDMAPHPDPVIHEYVCGCTLPLFPPGRPPSRCPYCPS